MLHRKNSVAVDWSTEGTPATSSRSSDMTRNSVAGRFKVKRLITPISVEMKKLRTARQSDGVLNKVRNHGNNNSNQRKHTNRVDTSHSQLEQKSLHNRLEEIRQHRQQVVRAEKTIDAKINAVKKTWNTFRDGYETLMDDVETNAIDLDAINEENDALKEALNTNQEIIHSMRDTINSMKEEHNALKEALINNQKIVSRLENENGQLIEERDELEALTTKRELMMEREIERLQHELRAIKAGMRKREQSTMDIQNEVTKEVKEENEYLRNQLNTVLGKIAASKSNTKLLAQELADERHLTQNLLGQMEECIDLEHQTDEFGRVKFLQYGGLRRLKKLEAVKTKLIRTRRNSRKSMEKVNTTIAQLTHPFGPTPPPSPEASV